MSNESMIEKAIEAIIALNAALTNIRLYPPTSAMIVNSIDSLHSIFQQFFEQQDSIVFAESERNLVISGEALDEKELSRPQVAAAFCALPATLALNFSASMTKRSW